MYGCTLHLQVLKTAKSVMVDRIRDARDESDMSDAEDDDDEGFWEEQEEHMTTLQDAMETVLDEDDLTPDQQEKVSLAFGEVYEFVLSVSRARSLVCTPPGVFQARARSHSPTLTLFL